MTRTVLPPPRVFKLIHPRLRRIRHNLRRVIQLAVSEEWEKLMMEKRSLLEDVRYLRHLSFRKRRLYYKLNDKANWLERCYLDSIIHKGLDHMGGADTDVSGDRVRVFIGKPHEILGEIKNVINNRFFSINEYKRKKCWLLPNYEKFAPLYKKHPDKFISFKKFYL